MSIFYKIASYIWDIPVEKSGSENNPYLEVVWSNGRKMLNTKEANFSFGNGYKVFLKAFNKVGSQIQKADSVLILGFGCGSILDILENEYDYKGELIGIEYDAKIIQLFKNHFQPDYRLTPELIESDAFDFIEKTDQIYDVICIDLFQELDNIPQVFNPKFLNHLATKGKTLVFNLTQRTDEDNLQISNLIINLSANFKTVERTPFQDINAIITAF